MSAEPVLAQLERLKLTAVAEQFQPLARQAAKAQWTHVEYLSRLLEAELARREDRALERRVKAARLPAIKTLDQFQWSWPKSINRMQVQELFRLRFVETRANVILLGGVGLGKTHLAIALAHHACLAGHSVLFTSAIDSVNTLLAAHAAGRLKPALNAYLKPRVLVLDELGYLPIDKAGADLLFQIVSQRYERGPIIITSNKAYKRWAEVFNNDATLTSALLDRLLHHADTVMIEGRSFRMKERLETD